MGWTKKKTGYIKSPGDQRKPEHTQLPEILLMNQ